MLTGRLRWSTTVSPTPLHIPPPPKKWYPVSRVYRPQNQKIHWGIVLLGKIMILQGVGRLPVAQPDCSPELEEEGGGSGGEAGGAPPSILSTRMPPWKGYLVKLSTRRGKTE